MFEFTPDCKHKTLQERAYAFAHRKFLMFNQI